MATSNHDRMQNQGARRPLPALDPASVRIDGRDQRDRLAFAAHYASLILYYDSQNLQKGDWQSFLLKEPAILLASISKTDYSTYHQQFIELQASLKRNQSADQEASCINQLCSLLHNMFGALNRWMHFMQRGGSNYSLRAFLEKKIDDSLAQQLVGLLAIQSLLSGIMRGQVMAPDRTALERFEPLLRMPRSGTPGSTTDDAIDTAARPSVPALVQQLSDIYFIVFDVFVQVIGSANAAFQQQQEQTSLFPDTALLMVFSRLMQTQQEQINGYTQQHLDFYYRQLLLQQRLPAQPDHAIVCLSLAPQAGQLTLPAGTAFKAGTYADQSDILFCNPSQVDINGAIPGAVYTLYYGQTGAPGAAGAKALYRAVIPQPASVQRNSSQEVLSWSAFGNDLGLAIRQGFALASPMLLLAAGQRTITVTMNRADGTTVPAAYFVDSQCYLSTADGWLPLVAAINAGQVAAVPPVFVANAHDVLLQPATASYSLQIQLQVGDPAIVAFAPGKGPDGYTSRWPVLKVILGPSADLGNPPLLSDVSIGVDVTQFDQFSLANDVSSLPSKGVQMLLGPLPNIGSHFYVGSNECFAKPLANLTLALNWDGLPPDFASYYAQYNQYLTTAPPVDAPLPVTPYANTCFAGSWSLLNKSSWNAVTPQVAKPDLALSLFQQAEPTSEIAGAVLHNGPSSIFSFIPAQGFVPVPELALAALPSVLQAKDGYLRFELEAPYFGFGQRLYASLVSYINLCNAQVLIGLSKTDAGKKKTKFGDSAAPSGNAPQPASSVSRTGKFAMFVVDALGRVIPLARVAEPLIDDAITEGPGLWAGLKSRAQRAASAVRAGFGSLWSGIKHVFSPAQSSAASGTTASAPAAGAPANSSSASAAGQSSAAQGNAPAGSIAAAELPPPLDPQLQLMPNLPYIPRISSVQGSSYSALASSSLNSTGAVPDSSYPLELYHYGSFVPYLAYDASAPTTSTGFLNLLPRQVSAAAPGSSMPLFPGATGDGCLYLSLQGISAPCTVNLYVELGTSGQQAMLDAGSVAYFYWSNVASSAGGTAGWQPLHILRDGTKNLNCSGILQIAIPALAVPLDPAQCQLLPERQLQSGQASAQAYWQSPLMPTPDFWIAIAACKAGIDIRISYLNTQAVCLTRTSMAGLAVGQVPAIAANTIVGPLNKLSQLAKVIQPFPSYGGVAAENDSSFSGSNGYYRRVSERLNHKNRASSSTDFVRMAHAACTQLFYARVLAGSNGQLRLGVVKGYADATDSQAFAPSLSSCQQELILDDLTGKMSAMAGIAVFNLKHQIVTISVRLDIDPQADPNSLRAQLNQRLKVFLSPWIASDALQVDVDEGIQQADLVSVVLGQPGVRAICTLSIGSADAQAGAPPAAPTFPVRAHSDDAILVSAAEHDISFGAPAAASAASAPVSPVSPVSPAAPAAPVAPARPAAPASPVAPAGPAAPAAPAAGKPAATGSEPMVMSTYGLQLLEQWEGSRAREYVDSAGHPTIGVGHRLTPSETASRSIVIGTQTVPYADGLSQQQISDLLSQDLPPVQLALNQAVMVALNQHQFDALCSFTFNVGIGALEGSTLLKVLNLGHYDDVPAQMLRWDLEDRDEVSQGLKTRRRNEVAVWNTPEGGMA